MGKRGEGLLESHRRKSGWGLRASRPSTSLSRAGSQLVIKWQLAKNTQWPAAMPSWISLLAMGACTPHLHPCHWLLFSINMSMLMKMNQCSINILYPSTAACKDQKALLVSAHVQASCTDLALTKRNSEELGAHAALQSQLAQDLSGVHPSRQNKDEG